MGERLGRRPGSAGRPGGPDQLDPEHEDAQRFDILLLNTQLALLGGGPFERQRKKIMQIASLLEASARSR